MLAGFCIAGPWDEDYSRPPRTKRVQRRWRHATAPDLTAHGTRARAGSSTQCHARWATDMRDGARFVRAQQTAAPYCQRYNLDPQIDPDLDEFSLIDPALLASLDGDQRKPYAKAYSEEPDLHRRLGANADTFAEFIERVRRFQNRMDTLTDGAVIFGHGIWLAMLSWLLLGRDVANQEEMRAFRAFQLELPMPNCVIFEAARQGSQPWRLQRVLR